MLLFFRNQFQRFYVHCVVNEIIIIIIFNYTSKYIEISISRIWTSYLEILIEIYLFIFASLRYIYLSSNSCLKFERDIIGKSNWLIIQQQSARLYTCNAHVCVNVFLAVALPNSSTKSRKLVAITSSNNETQFPRFPCNYLVEQKATVAGFYCLIVQQQATIPLSTSLTSCRLFSLICARVSPFLS